MSGLPYKNVFETPDDAPNEADTGDGRGGAPIDESVKVWHGLFAATATLIALVFIGSPVQYYMGMSGLAITELVILLLAFIFTFGFKRDFQAVFPFRRPKARQLVGTLLVWFGFWGASMLAALFIELFFPGMAVEAGEGLSDFFRDTPYALTILVVAVMPAICEEAMFRGFIQHSFGRLGKWSNIMLAAVLFGLFHMDPARVLPTGILGFGLAYIMIKTDNLLLPMLFHFINNAMSASMSFLPRYLPAEIESSVAAALTLDDILVSLLLFIGVPTCVLVGGILLEKRRPNVRGRFRDKRVPIAVAVIVTLLLVAGFAIGVSRSAGAGTLI